MQLLKIEKQKAPENSGALSLRAIERSVPGYARAAELVVEAGRDHIDILADPVAENGTDTSSYTAKERIVGATHEEVIVFDAERPVRSEEVLKTDADRATPTSSS